MASKKHNYDESKIKTLSSLEHIRTRTGMYIGRVGDGSDYNDGIYILLKEVIDNSIDEHIMGFGNRIQVTIKDGAVAVRDFGRGIPFGKLVDCVSRINTGAKYNTDVFQFSVGLNGVGTKAVNALSRTFLARSHREGAFAEARFERGELKQEKNGRAPDEPDGTFFTFAPDPQIFGSKWAFREELIQRRLQMYTYLNAGLTIEYNGESIVSADGLLDLVHDECHFEKVYNPLHFRDERFELAFTHTNRFSEAYFSFVNGQFTEDGGTHLSAFREGLLKAINEFAKKRYEGDDVREGLVGAVAIRLQAPIFESQTKNKLSNTEIRADLVQKTRDVVMDLLHRNPQASDLLVNKIEETHKLRQQLQSVKKMARERSKSVSVRIPQLKDSRSHFQMKRGKGADTMIFITEGQSAAGSLVTCRNPETQAIFALKGKPLNVCDLNRDALYKNVEIYNLMRSLDIEDSLERLRYGRIILATDADVDGLHIRNLLVTFFLRFFQPLVEDGYVHVLETPLFRVRNKKETRYCYNEAERDAAVDALGRGHEVTRFKGLGEISPSEFRDLIAPATMRLTPVSLKGQRSIPEVVEFYMGRNTQERRDYIMKHLIEERDSA